MDLRNKLYRRSADILVREGNLTRAQAADALLNRQFGGQQPGGRCERDECLTVPEMI